MNRPLAAVACLVLASANACTSGEASRDIASTAASPSAPAVARRTIGSVERLDARCDAIIPSGAQMEVLAEGHEWTEGPVWVPAMQAVLYSDIPRNAIYIWRDGSEATVWLKPSGYTSDAPAGRSPGSNGLMLDGEARLVLAQHGDRRMARLEGALDANGTVGGSAPAPKFATLADRWQGKRFNSPNDMAMRGNGDIYFTDPPYGLDRGASDKAREIGVCGVYRLAVDGTVTLIVDDLSRPNGIAFSPDERTLYVANSDRAEPKIMAYPVHADGSIGPGTVFYESWGDGIAVDQQGNLYVAGPGDGVIIIGADGKHLGSLKTGHATANCKFGEDGSTLFITADAYLLRVRLGARGVETVRCTHHCGKGMGRRDGMRLGLDRFHPIGSRH